jgi:hypothetical protein
MFVRQKRHDAGTEPASMVCVSDLCCAPSAGRVCGVDMMMVMMDRGGHADED